MRETRQTHETLEKKVWLGYLLGHYGGLLTNRQRELMALHEDDDLSLSEIAQQEGISRQGVHDALRRAQQQLEQWEEQLGLAGRTLSSLDALNRLEIEIGALPENRQAVLMREVQALRQIWEESDGV